jgi:hypothetical protein
MTYQQFDSMWRRTLLQLQFEPPATFQRATHEQLPVEVAIKESKQTVACI